MKRVHKSRSPKPKEQFPEIFHKEKPKGKLFLDIPGQIYCVAHTCLEHERAENPGNSDFDLAMHAICQLLLTMAEEGKQRG